MTITRLVIDNFLERGFLNARPFFPRSNPKVKTTRKRNLSEQSSYMVLTPVLSNHANNWSPSPKVGTFPSGWQQCSATVSHGPWITSPVFPYMRPHSFGSGIGRLSPISQCVLSCPRASHYDFIVKLCVTYCS